MLNELAEMDNCNNCLFLETRRHEDLYMWLSKTPNGPSIRFLVQNVHTMDELRMTGNHLKGTRPLLSFDKAFDSSPHWKLIKEILCHTFNVPRGHPRSKPFFDHIFSFTLADGRIWFRNFQIVEEGTSSSSKMSLVEVGPRFTLWPIRIFARSFGGPSLYVNPDYVSPQEERQDLKRIKSRKYASRTASEQRRQRNLQELELSDDELDHVFDE
jgi:ribosome biogenesis protein BRX1